MPTNCSPRSPAHTRGCIYTTSLPHPRLHPPWNETHTLTRTCTDTYNSTHVHARPHKLTHAHQQRSFTRHPMLTTPIAICTFRSTTQFSTSTILRCHSTHPIQVFTSILLTTCPQNTPSTRVLRSPLTMMFTMPTQQGR